MGVHPLEQLRYLARRWGSGDEFPAPEAAEVLAELADESPGTLVHACRRLIEYFPASGQAWWLSARALCAPDPLEAIWEAADELADDPTGRRLAEALPASARRRCARPVRGRSGRPCGGARTCRCRRRPARAQIVVVPALAAGPRAGR